MPDLIAVPIPKSFFNRIALPRGTYRFDLVRVYATGDGPEAVHVVGPVPFDVDGKAANVEKYEVIREPYDEESERVTLRVWVRIIENPIFLLAMIGIAAGAIGFASWGVSESIDNFRATLNHPLVWVGVGLLALYLLPRLLRKARS